MKKKILLAFVLCVAVVASAWGEARIFAEYPTLGECTGDNVRIRSEPNTNSEIVGRLNEYDKIIVLREVRTKMGYGMKLITRLVREKHTFSGNISCRLTNRNFNAVKVLNS